MKLPSFPRALLKGIFRTTLVLVFLGAPLLVFSLNRWGLPPGFTAALSESLSGEHYRVSIGRLRLSPLSGLLAEKVLITNGGGGYLAKINRLAVSLSLSKLANREVQVESLTLRHSEMVIPFGEDLEASLQFVNAKILLIPGQLRVSRCELIFEGVRLNLQGTLRNPEDFSVSDWNLTGGEMNASTESPISRALEILRAVEFFEEVPQITVEFRGDLRDPSSISADSILFQADQVAWEGIRLREISLEGSWAEGLFSLQNFVLKDDSGSLQIIGEYDQKIRNARLQLRSSLNPAPWIRHFSQTPWVEEIFFSSPPNLDLTYDGDWSGTQPVYSALGRVEVEGAAFREIPIDRLEVDFAWRPEGVLVRGASLSAPSVQAKFDAMVVGRLAKARIVGKFTPTLCLPWLDEGLRKIVREMEFGEAAWAEMELEMPLGDSAKLSGSGKAVLGRTAMRGAWIDSASADVSIEDRAVAYENLEIRMDGGIGTGAFIYDFGRKEVRLPEVQSTLPPAKILLWVDPRIAKTVSAYRFRSNPDVRGSGVVDMGNPSKTQLDLTFRASGGLEYDLLGKTLPIGESAGAIRVRGEKLRVNVPQARLFEGIVSLHADLSLEKKDPGYFLEAELDRVDFASLNKLYFNYSASTGWLSGSIAYSAKFSDQTMLKGTGSVKVEEGNVFAIPLLGPFSAILNSIVPGMGYQKARQATADFTVGNRIIHTDNLEIEGQGFSLFGEGDIHFVADRLDMSVRLNAKGIPGLLLFPVSKLFEYVSSGPVSKPTWRPKNVPKELMGGEQTTPSPR